MQCSWEISQIGERLVFGDQLRLKAALSVTGNLNRQLTKLTLERLLTFAIASIAICVGDR